MANLNYPGNLVLDRGYLHRQNRAVIKQFTGHPWEDLLDVDDPDLNTSHYHPDTLTPPGFDTSSSAPTTVNEIGLTENGALELIYSAQKIQVSLPNVIADGFTLNGVSFPSRAAPRTRFPTPIPIFTKEFSREQLHVNSGESPAHDHPDVTNVDLNGPGFVEGDNDGLPLATDPETVGFSSGLLEKPYLTLTNPFVAGLSAGVVLCDIRSFNYIYDEDRNNEAVLVTDILRANLRAVLSITKSQYDDFYLMSFVLDYSVIRQGGTVFSIQAGPTPGGDNLIEIKPINGDSYFINSTITTGAATATGNLTVEFINDRGTSVLNW